MEMDEKVEDLQGVAIIAMACRLPGAAGVEAFWENLRQGVESISFFSDDELTAIDPRHLSKPNYVKALGTVADADQFDAGFWGMSPAEAGIMDPQQRLFLECAWEALERAGYNPETHGETTGVVAGADHSTHGDLLRSDPDLADSIGEMPLAIGNNTDHLALRTSYLLNLRGPSVPVQTACSTSLVAVHIACQMLLNYECDMVLAGGASIHAPLKVGYFYEAGGPLSPDGHCRAFDADSGGTAMGSGVGVMLLKRLANAVEDGDHIHAVILGSAINNDGGDKIGYTAPSVSGQRRVIEEALALAQIEPEQIGYIETHGTGTTLGDPIEIEALRQAFGEETYERPFCALGSVKTNVGHCNSAAGIVGLLKAALCIEHGELVPSLNFKNPNPRIRFQDGPFYVSTETKPWPEGERFAGVSSFGIGGTNAHVILSQPPPPVAPPSNGSQSPESSLLVLSARTPTALARKKEQLAEYLDQAADPALEPGSRKLADLAFTLAIGRKPMEYRAALVDADTESAIARLREQQPVTRADSKRSVAFLFPGQGADYRDLGAALYREELPFREAVDTCCERLRPVLGLDLTRYLFAKTDEARALLKKPSLWQPALFVSSYATARLWMARGIQPKAMIGHSLGEYVAATLAGVWSLEDGLNLVAQRGEATQSLAGGSMLAVILAESELLPMVTEPISLAAVNGPKLCVLAGPVAAIADLARDLKAQGIHTIALATTHAFHSQLMEPMMDPLRRTIAGFSRQAPEIPFISNVTGTWITHEDAVSPDYWARHLRQPVRFHQGLSLLMGDPSRVLLEVGPGKVLSNLARRIPDFNPEILSSMPGDRDQTHTEFLDALGNLWRLGLKIDWASQYEGRALRRVALPTYPFERSRYWLPDRISAHSWERAQAPAQVPRVGSEPRNWVHVQGWKSLPDRLRPGAVPDVPAGSLWLVFADPEGLARALGARIQSLGGKVIWVTRGPKFDQSGEGTYNLDPSLPSALADLIENLKQRDSLPGYVVFGWPLDMDRTAEPVEKRLDSGYAALVRLIQAWDAAHIADPLRLGVLTRGIFASASRSLASEEWAIAGLADGLSLELANPCLRVFDLACGAGEAKDSDLDGLIAEWVMWRSGLGPIALQSRKRWGIHYEPLDMVDGELVVDDLDGRVFLITNGFQEMGFALAEHLALDHAARVVLADCRFLPPVADWDTWLAEQGAEDPVSKMIARLQKIVADGGRIIALKTDLTSIDEMLDVVIQAADLFGAIGGVFRLDPPAEAQRVRQVSRVRPAQRLHQTILEAETLGRVFGDTGFLMLFSRSPETFGPGHWEDGAIAGYLAAFAEDLCRRAAVRAQAISWGPRVWDQGAGIARDAYGLEPFSAAECFAAIDFAVGLNRGPVVLCRRDYGKLWSQAAFFRDQNESSRLDMDGEVNLLTGDRVRGATQPKRNPADRDNAVTIQPPAGNPSTGHPSAGHPSAGHPRPQLANEFVAPRSPVESVIARAWCRVFDLREVGVNDDFFELGGHSLLAIQLISSVNDLLRTEFADRDFFGALPPQILFETPTIAALAARIETNLSRDNGAEEGIVPLGPTHIAPLSFAQERAWIAEQIGEGGTGYNIPIALRWRGPLDQNALIEAIGQVVTRHDALRALFIPVEGRPQLVIDPRSRIGLRFWDLCDLPADRREGEALAGMAICAAQEFDIAAGPPLRVALWHLGEDDFLLLIVLHHIIADHWSFGVLLSELNILYPALSRGENPELPPLAVQYQDYAWWQRQRLQGETLDKLRAFWLKHLDGAPSHLTLPTTYPRPAKQTYRGGYITFQMPPSMATAINAFCRGEGVTLFMVLLAAFKALLARYAGQTDISIGTPMANRIRPEVEPLIGYFVNTLVLRTRLAGHLSFREWVARVRTNTLNSFAHQELPFEQVVDLLAVKRNPAYSPLFQVLFVLQSRPLSLPEFDQVKLAAQTVYHGASLFDLSLTMAEIAAGLDGELEYNADLFSADAAQGLTADFCDLLERAVAAPDQTLEALTAPIPVPGAAQSLHAVQATSVTANPSQPLEKREQRKSDLSAKYAKLTPAQRAKLEGRIKGKPS